MTKDSNQIIKGILTCQNCKKEMVRIVRLSETGESTFSTCKICTNLKCIFGLDLEKVKTWKKI